MLTLTNYKTLYLQLISNSIIFLFLLYLRFEDGASSILIKFTLPLDRLNFKFNKEYELIIYFYGETICRFDVFGAPYRLIIGRFDALEADYP